MASLPLKDIRQHYRAELVRKSAEGVQRLSTAERDGIARIRKLQADKKT